MSPLTRINRCAYLVGIWAAPEAGVAGGNAALLAAGATGATVPGMAAAPEAAMAGAGAPARSSTLTESTGRRLPK
jgi:hypothetical protein